MEEADSTVNLKKMLFGAAMTLQPGVSHEAAASYAIQAFEIAALVLQQRAGKGQVKERAPLKDRKHRQAELRAEKDQLTSRHATRAAVAALAAKQASPRRHSKGNGVQLDLW